MDKRKIAGIALLSVGTACDFLSTAYGLSHGATESNPMLEKVFMWSWVAFVAYRVSVVAGISLMATYEQSGRVARLCWFFGGLYVLGALVNMYRVIF